MRIIQHIINQLYISVNELKDTLVNKLILLGFIIPFIFCFSDIYSQPTVISDSIINHYTKVLSLSSSVSTDPDSVFVEDASLFNKNEVALLIVTSGASIYTSGADVGMVENMNNTGKYVLLGIDTVDYSNNLIIFNSTLPNISILNFGESAQLISVPRYKSAIISGTLSCKAWDPVSGTGGVTVLIVDGVLELQGDIDVSGKGFPGALPGSEKYEGTCSSFSSGYLDGFFSASAKDSAGFKGGSIVSDYYSFARGRFRSGNGGGGGNAKYSGGGGGSNGGVGGKGGYEFNGCSPGQDMGGYGGFSLYTTGFYKNDGEYANRIFMGGGGGSSTQNSDEGKFATAGGNGGGIVILMANKLIASGHSIKANGQSVTEIATAGAGGGGAGGVILTDVLEYVDNLIVEVKGGKGGDCVLSADSTGPGGGGGAGVYWFDQENLPSKVTSDRSFGFSGKIGTSTYGATNGSNGNNIANLVLPRRGFIENRIPDDQLICGGTIPEVLNAPEAKGGAGPPYTYKWIQSAISETGPWIPANGINNLQNYSPPAIYDTTYFARIVSDGALTDTSFAIQIAVHPALQNNIIEGKDTICASLSPGMLSSSEISGGLGEGTYSYHWEYSIDNSLWEPASGVNNTFSYNAPSLNETTYYRRKVSSGVCIDTSDVFRVLILPLLTNNNIASDQTICFDQQPAALTGTDPVGGLDGDRKYQWQSAVVPGNWKNESNLFSFLPNSLTDTTFFRRIVYSGPDNTCQNISDSIKISVLPEIINNFLYHSPDTTICAGLPSLSFIGSQPGGGDGTYKYSWETRAYHGDSWTVDEETLLLQPFQTDTLNDTVWIRRVVKSGPNDVCYNSGDSLLIKVLPLISNNSISNAQIICENDIPFALTGSNPSGGQGDYSYKWQHSPDGISNWIDAIPPGESKDYNPPALTETSYFRRIVFSGPENTCQSFSDNLKIEVQPSITNNVILTQSPFSTCFNTQPSIILGSTDIRGGDGSNYSFQWLQSSDLSVWETGTQPANQANYQAETLSEEIYYRRVVSSGFCKDTTDIIHVEIDPLPVLNKLLKSVASTTLCDDQQLSLKLEIEKGEAPYIIGYRNGIDSETFYANLLSDSDSINVNIYGGNPNQFNFTIESLIDNNGCSALEQNLNAFHIEMDVYRSPAPKINLPDTVNVCGNSVMLSVLPDIGNGSWYNENPDIIINDVLSINPTASVNIDSYNFITDKFFYSESTPACGVKKDSVTVNFYEEPGDVLITNDLSGLSQLIVFLADNVVLNAETPTAGTGQWNIVSGPGTISTQNNNSAKITGLVIDEATKVSFTITNGVCDLKKDELVIERKNLKVYEGFSPNGDLLNDFLYAEGIDRTSPDLSYVFTIFNSSGAFVREITKDTPLDTQENNVLWDGKTNGGNMAGDGTYYYILRIDYKGKEFVFKGFFVLKTE